MAQVLVRDLPDDVVERLKAKAALAGRSLEAELRRILAAASELDRSELAAAAAAIRASTAGTAQSDSTAIIREARDGRP